MTSREQRRAGALEKKQAAGKRLATARAALGLTQQQLADAVGASLQTIKSYEGGRRTPSGKYAVALTRVGVSLAYVLEGGSRPAVLPEGEGRESIADALEAGRGDEAASVRQQRRVGVVMDRLRLAHTSVADAAKNSGYDLPELFRQMLVLAVFEGMKPSALKPVMEMLQAQSLLDASRSKTTGPRRR